MWSLVHKLRCVKNIWFLHFKKNQVDSGPGNSFHQTDEKFNSSWGFSLSISQHLPKFLIIKASGRVSGLPFLPRPFIWLFWYSAACFLLAHLGYLLAAVGGKLRRGKTLHSPSTKHPMAGSQRADKMKEKKQATRCQPSGFWNTQQETENAKQHTKGGKQVIVKNAT